jgi:hypothetical protein
MRGFWTRLQLAGLVRNPDRRRLRAVVALALAGVVAAIAGTALAVHDEGLFELDANVQDEAAVGDDWSNIFDDTADDADPKPLRTVFKTEAANETIFTGGGSKDYLGINNDPPADPWTDGPWQHKNGSVPDKDDIRDAYAAAYTKQEGGVPHTFIYFGLDRLAVQGSADVGFWFLKGNVAPVAGGSWSGEHQVGDVLVLSEFSGGGTDIEIKVLKWVGTGGDEGGGTLETLFGGATGQLADCDEVPDGPDGDDVCANVNTAPILDAAVPWNYVAKNGSRDIPTAGFFEGGIDLTDFVPGAGCVANFVAETRSSFEVNAVLKDFVHSSFSLCGASLTTTPSNPISGGTVLPGASVTDKATVTGTGLASPPFPSSPPNVVFSICGPIDPSGATSTFKCDDSDAVHTAAQFGNTKALSPTATQGVSEATSDAVSKTLPGVYCFKATWAGDTSYPAGASDIGSNGSECFRVRDTSSMTTAQRWLPNDSATVLNSQNQPVTSGTVDFTLYKNGTCTDDPLDLSDTVTGTGFDDRPLNSSGVASTANTTQYVVTSSGTTNISWKATYDGSADIVGSNSTCETSVLQITN